MYIRHIDIMCIHTTLIYFIYTYIHTYIHTYMHAYIHIYIHTLYTHAIYTYTLYLVSMTAKSPLPFTTKKSSSDVSKPGDEEKCISILVLIILPICIELVLV